MFLAQIPDATWKDITCPALLLAAIFLLRTTLGNINVTMVALKAALDKMPQAAQLPAPPPYPPHPPSQN